MTAIREIKLCKALKHVNVTHLREVVVYNEANDRESVELAQTSSMETCSWCSTMGTTISLAFFRAGT